MTSLLTIHEEAIYAKGPKAHRHFASAFQKISYVSAKAALYSGSQRPVSSLYSNPLRSQHSLCRSDCSFLLYHQSVFVHSFLFSELLLTTEPSQWRTTTPKLQIASQCIPILSTCTQTAQSFQGRIRLCRLPHLLRHPEELARLSNRWHKQGMSWIQSRDTIQIAWATLKASDHPSTRARMIRTTCHRHTRMRTSSS